jgi:hypothetical protein
VGMRPWVARGCIAISLLCAVLILALRPDRAVYVLPWAAASVLGGIAYLISRRRP